MLRKGRSEKEQMKKINEEKTLLYAEERKI
jgi:hypothetical protein